MADSNITKRALASALRELMEEVPFDKIQVTHICERCNMNRKSFYYHFRDKYDLLNWIFDTEMISMIRDYTGKEPLEQYVEILREICNYLYKNRDFYRNALKIQGQNSFSDHFREYLRPLTKLRLVHLIEIGLMTNLSLIFSQMLRFMLLRDGFPKKTVCRRTSFFPGC